MAGELEERRKQAFLFAQDTTKQLLTLATGLIAVGTTFFDKIAKPSSPGIQGLMAIGWIFFLVSVIFGLMTLMALTGSLEPKDATTEPPSVRGDNVVDPAKRQGVTFIIGLIITILAGLLTMLFPASAAPAS